MKVAVFLILTLLIFSCSDKYSRMVEIKEKNSRQISTGSSSGQLEEKLERNSDTVNIDKEKGEYAVALYDTPILNTPDFKKVYGGSDGKTLSLSKNGLIKELEYVAFPGTVFKILEEYNFDRYSIFKVATDEYQIILGGTNLYIDSRFVRRQIAMPDGKTVIMPTKKEIYAYLDSSLGSAYVWGANNIHGVEKMLEFYKPSGKLSNAAYDQWCIKGVDCSGLMYEATKGFTARNTHQLVNFGKGLNIEGKSAREISKMLDSLDMIVWKGHVIYVYDENTTIESSHSAGGVVMKDLISCLEKIMKTREPANEWDDNKGKIFVVRRWW